MGNISLQLVTQHCCFTSCKEMLRVLLGLNGTEIVWELNVRKANHATENSGKFWEESRSYGTVYLARKSRKLPGVPFVA